MSEQEHLIELIGEDGEAVQFEHLMTVEYKAEYYIVLSPAEPEDDEEAGQVVIMRITKDVDGQDCYEVEENEDTLQAVFDKFIEMIEEEDDAIPTDDEEE